MPSPTATAAAIRPLPTRSPACRARRTALALGIAAAAGAGCGGGAVDRSADAGGGGATARPAAAAPAARREFDVCALAPEADVDAALKQAGVNSTVTRAGGSGGQCSYRSTDGVASLLLEVADFRTAELAQQLLGTHRSMAVERKYPIQEVTDIGDQGAIISDWGETAGLLARKGAVTVTANLKLENSSPEQRHRAVEALGRKLIAQLPSP
jgi:hypothetical protein